MVNYYAELGLDRGLDIEALKDELAKLRRKWQTRANGAPSLESRQEAERKMELIREASSVLLVKEEKEKYDKKLDKDPVLSNQYSAQTEDNAPAQTDFLDTAMAIDALQAAYRQDKYNTVLAIANKLISQGDAPIEAYHYAILTYVECGNLSMADKMIADMMQAMPEEIEAHYIKAVTYLRIFNGRAKDARESIDFLLQSEEGASPRVAALDVEYYIDTNDFALADKKTEDYKTTVGRDKAFTESVGIAYRQHAESFLQEYGGDAYFDSKEQYTNWKKYNELSLSIYPDAAYQSQFQNNLKLVGGITFVKSNFPGILFAFILGGIWAGGSSDVRTIGILFILIGLFITVFSFVPKWMDHRSAYTGHYTGPYEIARYAAKVVGVIFNGLVWLVKTIIRLIFAFI